MQTGFGESGSKVRWVKYLCVRVDVNEQTQPWIIRSKSIKTIHKKGTSKSIITNASRHYRRQ